MKKNQKQQPLSKKQRKKLEKSGVTIKTREPRTKMPREKKWLISLVAALCVMAIACASFGGILLARVITNALHDPYASAFEEIKLNKHINTSAIDEKFYTANIFDFSKIEENYVPMTLADMDDYIEGVRVNYRTLNKEMQKDRVIGLGDTVAAYVTDIFKGDSPLTTEDEKANRLTVPSKMEELFGSYTGYITFVVGAELFGKDFDDKVIEAGIKPIDTVREIRQNNKKLEDGSLVAMTEEDTVCITYYFQKSKGASATPYAEELKDRYNWSTTAEAESKFQSRVKLSELEATLRAALIDNCKAMGETFTFVMENYDLTGSGKESDRENDYLVTAQAHFALTEEVTKDITFTFPEGYFGENDGDFYALNGKTATLRMHILYSDDYEPATFDRQFITETLKMEISATDDAGAVAEYKQAELERLNRERAENKLLAQYDAAISHLVKKASGSKYFLETTANTDQMAAAVQAQITRNLLERYLAAKGQPPTTAELDAYAISLAKMQDISVSGAQEYIDTVFSSDAASMKQSELLVYAIFKAENMKITDEMLDEAYGEYMAKVTGSMWDAETHNEEYFVKLYGEETIKSWVRHDLVYKMVGEFLVSVNGYDTKAQ